MTISAVVGDFDGVHWAPEVNRGIRAEYQGDVEAGIDDARTWHLSKGGADASFQVTELGIFPVDTKADAVRCAATAAAWKALGNSEAELSIAWDGDRWVVTFGRER